MVEPVDYHLLLKYPDRDEPENADFTSFTGEITKDDVLSLPEKGEWRVEAVRVQDDLPNVQLLCVPA